MRQKTQVATPSELAAAREARGMSQLDISQRIKLQVKQVNALEEGQWEALPGRSFVRGALRSYGKLLDVDVAPLLESIGGFAEPAQVQGMQPLDAPISRSSGHGFNGGGRGSPILWVIAGLIGVVALVLYFGSDQDSSRIRSWLPSGETKSGAEGESARPPNPSGNSPAPGRNEGTPPAVPGISGSAGPGTAPAAGAPGSAAANSAAANSAAANSAVSNSAVANSAATPQAVQSTVAQAASTDSAAGQSTPGRATATQSSPSQWASAYSTSPGSATNLASSTGLSSSSSPTPLSGPASSGAATPAGASPSGLAPAGSGPVGPAGSNPAASAGQGQDAPTATLATAAPAGANAAGGAPAAADVKGVLHVKAAEDSWVEVRQADGSALHNGLVKGGATIELKGVPPYRVVVGNASHVALSFEGKAQDLTPHIRANNIARLQLR
jgi:cytoskeleton protein RodZ